jgi:tRNA modification GTPase
LNGSAIDCQVTRLTATAPGAVAILQVTGADSSEVVRHAFGLPMTLPIGGVRLADFGGIDTGLLVRVAEAGWQLMPHGGPRIVTRMIERLRSAGAVVSNEPDAARAYPEARSPIEADMLRAIARAASPAAIDLLARQPALWRAAVASSDLSADDAKGLREDPRDRLLSPPTVAVVGRPNVGKSTLLNALAGRSAALVADLPGTTRDWVGAVLELVPPGGEATADAVAVHWLDTPGLRDSDDATEQSAIAATRQVIADVEVLIVLRSPEINWPSSEVLPREPDLWVINKSDQVEKAATRKVNADRHGLWISAREREGLDALVKAVLAKLELHPARSDERPWAFSDTLRRFASHSPARRAAYVGQTPAD